MTLKPYYSKVRSALIYTALLTAIFLACKTSVPRGVSSNPAPTRIERPLRLLVFTKTKGWYHTSIPSGIAALQKLGKENNFIIDTTKKAEYFVADSLKNYSAVVFLNTTRNVLNADQQVAFERYIQAGGGFVGIHSAADTEYDWPWYNRLVGAYFQSHPNNPNVRPAAIDILDSMHISTEMLPKRWERTDEWYNYKNIQADLKILANLDEDSYEGGNNGVKHPIAWYHEFDGGRAFYTGGGHTDESYSEPLFLKHLLGGIRYAIGNNLPLDYSKAYSVKKPEENRFVKTVLANDLNEPMELAVTRDGRVFFIERGGNFYAYNPADKQTTLVHTFMPYGFDYKNGLLGITVDPDFEKNNFIYFFYTAEGKNQQPKQNVSRFTIDSNNQLNLKSEKVIIEIPIDLERSAHTGGSLAWDKDKNLYISTGDNTNPFESEGFAPIDRRQGRDTYTAERSSSNTNDLRGKILRIHPNADGSYSIPKGNLFAPGTPKTKPEIYVMGCRNPYRISVDAETGTLYWGEIGPDSGTDGKQGPKGYDEFNQAKTAGNYGWPYFVGDNKPYRAFDFQSKVVGDFFNEQAPVNLSPLNTGAQVLPATRKAMVWYPYDHSNEFPLLGQGGRCAMGGPFYNYDPTLTSKSKIPEYFDRSLFVYDWMRNWVFALRFDEQQNYVRMEPFMQSNGDFRRPVDMEIGPDGSFYMLEYGSVYGIDNADARLVRIDFNTGNRAPVAKINTADTIGMAPYKVALRSGSLDSDDDDILSYEWRLNGKPLAGNLANTEYTFKENGIYQITLRVTDDKGASSIDTLQIKVGNTLPKLAIHTENNGSFFFGKKGTLRYRVEVKDAEDKVIEPKRINVRLNFIAKVDDNNAIIGHQDISPSYNLGKALMAKSDCNACHQMDAKSVGPSFVAISNRYKRDKGSVSKLADKIITGGGGVWGEYTMSAHPQLSKADASEIVKYILSVTEKKNDVSLPAKGLAPLTSHQENPEGRYILTASYTDAGGFIKPLRASTSIMLRPSRVEAEQADVVFAAERFGTEIAGVNHRSYVMLRNLDLKGISQLSYRYASEINGSNIEVRVGSLKGKVISKLNIKATGNRKFVKESASITNPGGRNDIYFVFVNPANRNTNLITLDWIEFEP